jgi:D-cysteine desulfhydrase family pyridoxal phosphate-dependent enzyme
MPPYLISEIKDKIKEFPRERLIHLPTPFQKLENLSHSLQGLEVYMKRDDLTGLAFGGNKSRKLEFIIKDALEKKADAILTWASLQSNWCLQTATAARKMGLKPVLLLFKTYDLPEEYDGNLLLDYIVDADIRIREAEKGKTVCDDDAYEIIDELVAELREEGYKPYVAPIGGSKVGGSMKQPLGAISYVNAFIEMLEQAQNCGFDINYVIHATGSGGTQAGLVVGAKSVSDNIKILGTSVSDDKETFSQEVLAIAKDTSEALELDLSLNIDDIIVFDEYIGEGYGIVGKEVAEVIRFISTSEAIMLDPVYTGKAMLALFDLKKKGYIGNEERVVFFHTGGTPAIFPNKHKLKTRKRKK